MKMKFILTPFVLLLTSVLVSAATNDVAALVQRGLFEEEANHQLDAAIGDYKEAIEHFGQERPLAATAIFRLGECYRKLGRTNEANAQYERIVREFPDQAQLAQLSQGYLPVIGGGATPGLAAGSPPLPSDEAEFLSKAIKSFQTSPDLVNQQLVQAVHSGYVSAAEYLLAHGADVKQSGSILDATQQGNDAMVKLLLTYGADVNSQHWDTGKHTALSQAVARGFMAVCLTLIANGADVNLQSPIVTAAEQGREAMVELLLSHGAIVDSTNTGGETALFSAVERGSMTLCHTLVAHGADVNAKDNMSGSTPLHLAVAQGNLAVAEFLITNKAQIDARQNSGVTSLIIAMTRSNTNMVKLLLDHHADANLKTCVDLGWWLSPLDWAIYSGSPEMVKLLLEAKADPNGATISRPPSTKSQSNTSGLPSGSVYQVRVPGGGIPGMPAGMPPRTGSQNAPAYVGYPPDYVGTRPQWDVWAQPVPGVTPLLWAAWGNPSHAAEIIQLLLDHGANPNPVPPDNTPTALVHAIDGGMIDVVRVLTAHGADVNALDKDGRPPLAHIRSPSSATGLQIEELLIKAGADANYNRRRAIWISGVGETSKLDLFQCPTNSINHYTLLESVAELYLVTERSGGGRRGPNAYSSSANPPPGMPVPSGLEVGGAEGGGFGGGAALNARREGPSVRALMRRYAHGDSMVLFPDFSRVAIQRLNGKSAETLHVNVADIFQSGDCSKDIALQPGDMVEIAKQEHKVAEEWRGLSDEERTALEKCLVRTVQVIAQSHTTDIALVPPIATYIQSRSPGPGFGGGGGGGGRFPALIVMDVHEGWLLEALKGRKADTAVPSFLLNDVVRDANVLLNTWDLSRVRLTRGGAKHTFDLTTDPAPDVWLEDGDVIEIPELGEAAPAEGAK
jgi:ankyrin repeat protein